jgi:hypothetical protein
MHGLSIPTGDHAVNDRRQLFPSDDIRARVLSSPSLETLASSSSSLSKSKEDVPVLRFPDGKLLSRKKRKPAAGKS